MSALDVDLLDPSPRDLRTALRDFDQIMQSEKSNLLEKSKASFFKIGRGDGLADKLKSLVDTFPERTISHKSFYAQRKAEESNEAAAAYPSTRMRR